MSTYNIKYSSLTGNEGEKKKEKQRVKVGRGCVAVNATPILFEWGGTGVRSYKQAGKYEQVL